jgi:excisionase family DNA binding protein
MDQKPTKNPNPTPTRELPPRYLTITELSEHLAIPVKTIYNMRAQHRGPRASKIGKTLRYELSEVHAWVRAQRDSWPVSYEVEGTI